VILSAEAFLTMQSTAVTVGDYSKITLCLVLGLKYWFIIHLLIIGGLALFCWLEK